MNDSRPVIAVILGDPAGIGPELVARLFDEKDLFGDVHTVLLGDRWLWQEGQRVAGISHQLPEVDAFEEARRYRGPVFLPMDTLSEGEVGYAEATVAGGASVLALLSRCMDAALAGEVETSAMAP